MRRGVALACGAVLLAAGCGGGSSESAARLRTQASRICIATRHRMRQIRQPTLGTGYGGFLNAGIALLTAEHTRLARLHPDGDDRDVYAGALTAVVAEVTQLRKAVAALHAQQDPALAFASLERRLRPLEARADGAWNALGIPACRSR